MLTNLIATFLFTVSAAFNVISPNVITAKTVCMKNLSELNGSFSDGTDVSVTIEMMLEMFWRLS
jgi:hypothetical protein